MPWTYSQSTGTLSRSGTVVGRGYSGGGGGLNNSNHQGIANQGPIPRGRYAISASFTHPQKGPIVMRLTPSGHNAVGRSGFLIHGDNRAGNNTASEGCIILSPTLRNQIASSGDRVLEVTQ